MSSPSAHPQLPLPFQTLLAQKAFSWSPRLRPEKCSRYLFSFVSTGSWSSHFSLENNRQPLQLQTCIATRNSDQVGAVLIPAAALGKHLRRNPSFPPLVFPNRTGDVPNTQPSYPAQWKCRERKHKLQSKGQIRMVR